MDDKVFENKKIAVVHDHLGWCGGGERTALTIAISLKADFISAYSHRDTFPEYQEKLSNSLIILSKKVINLEIIRYFWLRELFRKNKKIFKKYDIIIASGHAATEVVAKYANKNAIKILYTHTPPRRIYDLYKVSRKNYKWFLRPLYTIFAYYWRIKYKKALKKYDFDIANSENIKERIKKYTGFIADAVIWPPVLTKKFKWIGQDNYFLSWGRVDEFKRIDLIVKSFKEIPEENLIVVSEGNRLDLVKKLSKGCPNIKIIGKVTDNELFKLVGNCRAAIYIPKDEDAGITHLEANAAGKPVIGANEGGLIETIIDNQTGLIIKKDPAKEDIIMAVKKMAPEWCLEKRNICQDFAKKFDEDIFINNIKEVVKKLIVKLNK